MFIPLTKEKNAERFKKSEHFLPAATADCSDVGKTRQLVEAIRRKRRSPIRVPQNPSTFHPPAQRNAFRRRDVRQRSTIVRPLKLIAETQPQLQPALLRLSAMISPLDRHGLEDIAQATFEPLELGDHRKETAPQVKVRLQLSCSGVLRVMQREVGEPEGCLALLQVRHDL